MLAILLFNNLLAELAAYAAVVSFKFACLITYGDNMKTISFEQKLVTDSV